MRREYQVKCRFCADGPTLQERLRTLLERGVRAEDGIWLSRR